MSRPVCVQEKPICVRDDGFDESNRVRCAQKILALPELCSQEELDVAVFRSTMFSKFFCAVQR